MMGLTLADRAALYQEAFPDFQPLYIANDKRIEGLWIMGNQYQTSGYYGAYPHGYLERVMSLFPDAERILHLFSGSLAPGPYTRFDLNPALADVSGDAHNLTAAFPPGAMFDLILADPPYSAEDAEHYGTPMIQRGKVFKQALALLPPGGWLVWLDQVLPMFDKRKVNFALAVGMIKSTNHRVRGVFGFERPWHGGASCLEGSAC